MTLLERSACGLACQELLPGPYVRYEVSVRIRRPAWLRTRPSGSRRFALAARCSALSQSDLLSARLVEHDRVDWLVADYLGRVRGVRGNIDEIARANHIRLAADGPPHRAC